jgi:hypothetical protein
MNVDLKKAAAKGVTVIQFAKDSIGAYDYTALGKEMLKADGDVEFERALSQSAAGAPSAPEPVAPPAPQAAAPETTTSGAIVPVAQAPEITAVAAPATESSSPASREVSFNIAAPAAREIYLVGDFNHWKINEDSRLSNLGDGRWEKKLGLAPGRYKYKYIIDGEWTLDARNNDREQNSFGTFDSVINL